MTDLAALAKAITEVDLRVAVLEKLLLRLLEEQADERQYAKTLASTKRKDKT